MAEKARKTKRKDILDYHAEGRPGKIEVVPSKPAQTQRDLSIAYSPGVAEPCLEIAAHKPDVYKYTAKGNLVAVISNGTAVLGLGDIGPEASKPVMEGKGVLFKIFADIDVFDLELDTKDPEVFIQTVKTLAPTFGGINLEDIKAPDCFEIEQRLREELTIPIMHDDQHGTAIITGAALLNALHLVKKDIRKIKMVFNGAGAAAISCAKLAIQLGVKPENLFMFDSKGGLTPDRTDLTAEKRDFVRPNAKKTVHEELKGADVFVGLSKGNLLDASHVKSMARKPILFALANPTPEIDYPSAKNARPDVIMATGRSDYPNQVNNVLGFPYIFRGALDVRATTINEAMKLAAVHAIAELAREPVPEVVNVAYNNANLKFGADYIIPKPFDPRLIYKVSMAVAKAAMDSGVALNPIANWDAYRDTLIARLGRDNKFIRLALEKAKSNPKRVVFAEGDNAKILKAAHILHEEGVAQPILLGPKTRIQNLMKELDLSIEGVEIIDPRDRPKKFDDYAQALYLRRQRKGMTPFDADKMMVQRNFFGCMMLNAGDADVFISGQTRKYPEVVKVVLQSIDRRPDVRQVAGMYILLGPFGPQFIADTTVNENPTAEELVEITMAVASVVKEIGITPKVALLSFSNFGSHNGEVARKMSKAVSILKKRFPDLLVEGEMQANFALNQELLKENFPFASQGLQGKRPNILIFPDLASSNISYKMLQSYGSVQAIGPFLMGLNKSAHVLQLDSTVREIVDMTTLAVVNAQILE
jgi:malate dehydrogenase (oxaloacetate-decarboxylating)(NADP+)